jgi:hypothetical protein
MLLWHRAPWLIDHGSALYFHHSPGWSGDAARSRDPFAPIKSHVLLHLASRIQQEDEQLASLLTPAVIDDIVGLVPDDWLGADAQDERDAYRRYFVDRLAAPRPFVMEASGAR